MNKYPALFLDRDGVINSYGSYIYKIKDFHFNNKIFELCRNFKKNGYKIIVVTNQAGVARKIFTEDDFHALNSYMLKKFQDHNIMIDGVFYCFHHPDFSDEECNCRKPKPGMLLEAIYKHNIDPRKSILIGDSNTDIEAGKNANVKHNLLIKKNLLPDFNYLMDKYIDE